MNNVSTNISNFLFFNLYEKIKIKLIIKIGINQIQCSPKLSSKLLSMVLNAPTKTYGNKYFEYWIAFSKSIFSNLISDKGDDSKNLLYPSFNVPYVTKGSPVVKIFPLAKINKKIIQGIVASINERVFLLFEGFFIIKMPKIKNSIGNKIIPDNLTVEEKTNIDDAIKSK